MSDNPPSDNPSPEDDHPEATLKLITNFLVNHEKTIGTSIDALANVIERIRPVEDLESKIEGLEEKVDELQRQIAELKLRLQSRYRSSQR